MPFRANETSVGAFFVRVLLIFPAKHEKLYVPLSSTYFDPFYMLTKAVSWKHVTNQRRIFSQFARNASSYQIAESGALKKRQMNLLEKVI